MEVARETLLEVAVSLVGVGFFVGGLLVVGLRADGTLSREGALGTIGVIVGFVLLMTALGYWLSGRREA